MDFDFVEVHRVKEFSFRPVVNATSEDEEENRPVSSTTENCESSFNVKRTKQLCHSVWNVDGEIIDEPAIHVRYVLKKYFRNFLKHVFMALF